MRSLISALLASAFAFTCAAAHADTQPVAVDAAQATFKRLQEHLAKSPLDFTTRFDRHGKSHGVDRGSARFQIQRPNLFRVEIDAGSDRYELVSDGKDMTIYNRSENKYAVLPAPATPFHGFSKFTGLTSVESQVLHFVGVIEDVAGGSQGLRVASAPRGGGDAACDAFTVSEPKGRFAASWKVWLQKSGLPLPCRFVVDQDEEGQSNVFTWTADPKFAPGTFRFVPPAGAKEVVSYGQLGLHPPR